MRSNYGRVQEPSVGDYPAAWRGNFECLWGVCEAAVRLTTYPMRLGAGSTGVGAIPDEERNLSCCVAKERGTDARKCGRGGGREDATLPMGPEHGSSKLTSPVKMRLPLAVFPTATVALPGGVLHEHRGDGFPGDVGPANAHDLRSGDWLPGAQKKLLDTIGSAGQETGPSTE